MDKYCSIEGVSICISLLKLYIDKGNWSYIYKTFFLYELSYLEVIFNFFL